MGPFLKFHSQLPHLHPHPAPVAPLADQYGQEGGVGLGWAYAFPIKGRDSQGPVAHRGEGLRQR